ncbi:ABC-2 family transporter protein [Peptococcaceae bacterium CEB3]|nr:ABC-2 family transporter protein [Peptococcaceae bacterium CEB3]
MKELLRNELYKIFSRKILYVAALAFLLIMGFVSYMDFSGEQRLYGNTREYYDWFKQYEGPLTQAKIRMAQNWNKEAMKGESYWSSDSSRRSSQFRLTGQRIAGLTGYIESADVYAKGRNNELGRLKHQLTTLKQSNGYIYRETLLHYNMLKNSSPTAGIFFTFVGDNMGAGDPIFFLTVLGTVVVAAMILLGISPAFSDEYSTNMDALILSSKNGKGPVITAKTLATAIYIVGTAVFFSLANFLIQLGLYGKYLLMGWNSPLQMFTGYIHSPYPYTFLQYFVRELGVHLFGSISLGLLVLLISALSRSNLIPFFIGGGIFALPILLRNVLGIKTAVTARIMDFSPTQLMIVQGLFHNFKAYNILGHPVLYPDLLLAVYTLVGIAAIVLTYKVFRDHQVR